MDFSLTEEQTILADSVMRFFESDYDFETRQAIAAAGPDFSTGVWQTMAELGWLAVPFSEDDGGLDGGPIEIMLMMEQFGRGLLVEPFLANVVLAGGALKRAGSVEQKSAWLYPMISGEQQLALAFGEPQARFDISNIMTTAVANGDSFLMNGRKAMVLNGQSADTLVVPARTTGGQTDTSGITLFAVPGDATGVSVRGYPTVDGLRAADIEFSGVVVPKSSVLGDIDNGFEILRDVIDEATLAICAEAVGIMQTMHDKAVEYSKNRTQFGVPIGSFQALQHRMVDTMIACEECRSLLFWTVMLYGAGDTGASKAINALKYQTGTAGIQVARESVQLHGGMGVTWELDIAHYFKRMTAIDVMFGNADFHLDRYTEHPGA
jgi:alkylation response protein AidB-like acyl-CoA dehydrogenase